MRLARLVPVIVTIAVLGACGGDQPEISETASAVLDDRVAEIRTLAEEREADAVIAKVDDLRSLVEQFRDDGEISDEAAERILASAAAVSENVAAITTTTTTTTTAPPLDDDDDDDKDEEKEKDGDEGGEGNGKGNDDD